ncbi:hypothetical protein [Gordonia jacobaea]|uniref:hypothetical protein n=1 Tax=Gordonia jacobaea TaxID=122202 RepID=UPI003D70E375
MKILDATRSGIERIAGRTNANLTRLITDDEGMSTAEYATVHFYTRPDVRIYYLFS